jgi:hypothetical protein
MTSATGGPKGRMAIGLVFIVVGLLLTLDQAGVLKAAGLFRWWPLLPIGIGIVKVRQPLSDGQRANGVALLVIGSLFLFVNVLSWDKGWPLLLVGAGGLLLWQAATQPGGPPPVSESSVLNEVAVMGGGKKAIRVADFRGGYVTVVMGGLDIDLRQCKMEGNRATIDVVAVWGGVELKVPEDWIVDGNILPIMGGFENKAQVLVQSDTAPRLLVRGSAVMGGIVIGN